MITGLYAGLMGLLFVVLTRKVIRVRMASGTPLGTGNIPKLQQRTRAHANFAEYVPFMLLLLLLAELSGLHPLALHGLG